MASEKPARRRNRSAGKKKGRPRFKASAADRRKVAAAVKAGLTQDEIATVLGISQPTLAKHFAPELEAKRKAAEFRPTVTMRKRVSIAAGGGMSRRDIALALGISVTKLTKHFRDELTIGALERRTEVLQAMHAAAKKGNVSAQRAYLSTVLASDEAPPRGRRPSKPSPGAPPKGKKEQAAEDAQNATEGTDWGDLLPPSGVTIQ